MRASSEGHEAIVRLLLARGAEQRLYDSFGWTAMHIAVENGHAGVIALLCAAPGAGAATARRTSEHDHSLTPLGLAVSRRIPKCAAILRAYGAPK